jgi:hypothetical protein
MACTWPARASPARFERLDGDVEAANKVALALAAIGYQGTVDISNDNGTGTCQ